MSKTGVLVHMNYLEPGWDELVWGEPTKSLMGSLPKLVQLLLLEGTDMSIVMYHGPSTRDGLNEGEYSKKYLLDHFDQLHEFPQLKLLLDSLSKNELSDLKLCLEKNIVVKDRLINTLGEITNAAIHFQEIGVTKVFQVAVASHAPRCVQLQALARFRHQIPPEQFWQTVLADTTFEGTAPDDVVVAEPPHRGDDPAKGIYPGITDLMKRYYQLPYDARQPFLTAVATALDGLTDQSKA